jgi:PEP-CTERM/exosortase A-associated glycosyltransferase
VKILHILDHSIPLHSGYTFRTRAILTQQAALGWKTVQLTSGKQGPTTAPVEEVDGLRFYRTPAPSGTAARLPMLQQWRIISDLERRLDAVVEQERPDLLHAHSPALNGVAALRVGKRRGIPVVYECRAFWEDAAADHGTSREWGPRYRLTRALEGYVFRNADAVTYICEGLRRDIIARGIATEKVTIIPNAVDIEQFGLDGERDEALAASLGLGDAPVLGFIGSFYAYEGLDLAIRAMAELAETNQEVRLLLVGGGPEDARLRALVDQLGLADLVHFTGRVPHDQVQRYYGLIDVLIYPRRSMRLTELVTPLKPLEAMAQGKLVLASDVGGHRELITDGQNGRLFEAGDVASLARAVLAMTDDRTSWQAQRDAGRRFVEQERNWPRSVARYAAVYGGLIDAAGLQANPRAVT